MKPGSLSPRRQIVIHLKKVWVRLKTVFKYFQHFRRFCKGENFDCDLPPCWIFKDHISCKQLSSIISRSILDQLATGAISLWDMIREVSPPLVVIPLTVAPSKPHLFNDDRFIHLSTIDKPFKLDILLGILCYVYKDSYQSVKDDKSGYDHTFWSDFFLAQSALFVCFFLSALGYCVGMSTSVLVPLQKFPFLDFISDTCLQAFTIILPPPQRRNLLLFCVTSCHERLWSLSRYKSWLVNAFQWP